MNQIRFDQFTKELAAATSRRQALKVFVGTVAGGVLWLSNIGRSEAALSDVGPGPGKRKCDCPPGHHCCILGIVSFTSTHRNWWCCPEGSVCTHVHGQCCPADTPRYVGHGLCCTHGHTVPCPPHGCCPPHHPVCCIVNGGLQCAPNHEVCRRYQHIFEGGGEY